MENNVITIVNDELISHISSIEEHVKQDIKYEEVIKEDVKRYQIRGHQIIWVCYFTS